MMVKNESLVWALETIIRLQLTHGMTNKILLGIEQADNKHIIISATKLITYIISTSFFCNCCKFDSP